MIKDIIMPSGGQTTDQSTVVEWLFKKGDSIKRGDVLLVVETDKATLEIESYADGILIDIIVPAGQTASAGDTLAVIGDKNAADQYQRKSNEEILDSSDKKVEDIDDEYTPIMMDSSKEKVPNSSNLVISTIRAMPNAKKFAKENSIDLNLVAKEQNISTIKLSDVQAYVNTMEPQSTVQTAEYEDVKCTNMRMTIAKRMLESAQNIPAFQATIEIDMSKCIGLRKRVNSRLKNIKVSYNDIIMKAISSAITVYPQINATFMANMIRIYKAVNIGLAVSVDGGLVVPVVNAVNKLSVSQIAQISKEKITKARGGSLKLNEMQGGTITLSNMGMYPIQHFSAIINPPEACIFALGSIEQKIVVRDGEGIIAPIMTVTAAFDHRVIDGAYGAAFLEELKRLLEDPALMIF